MTLKAMFQKEVKLVRATLVCLLNTEGSEAMSLSVQPNNYNTTNLSEKENYMVKKKCASV